ncbi:hypothetical protein RB595_002045 [Gaeumannomyces hyphopodioides]
MDVRSLLRQQRARRIDHPHAAYSDAGRLLCLVCHEPVRPESWDAHVGTSTHRHRAATKQLEAPAEPAQGPKRKHDEPEDKDGKRSRNEGKNDEGKRNDDVMPSPGTPARRAPHTPPLRQSGGTPVLGVELQIPSRPATPNARDGIGLGMRNSPVERVTDKAAKAPTAGFTADKPVDEDEWAAFEAEVVNAPPVVAPIVAAPMTAEQVAEAGTKRRMAADVQMEDEREEATWALEAEFEEMEELEARVRRLKERREALRVRTVAKVDKASPKEASDDEDESEDDWDAFRFR